jgi:hypothetical protein
MPYVTAEAEVWIDLHDFETEDLVDELKSRKASMPAHVDSANAVDLVNEIYIAKHVRQQDYDRLVDELIYSVLGKIV